MKTGKTECALLLTLVMVDAVFLAGCACAGSLRPIASPETLTTVPQLEGTWHEADNKETLTVTHTAEKSYQLRWREEDKDIEVIFDLSLVQIDTKLFFDAAFNHVETKEGSETAYDLGVLPIHFIGRIWVDEKSLRLGLLEYEWLQKKTQDGQVNLPYLEHHSKDEELILFTAKAEDVQAFLRQYAEDREAFPEKTTFERVPPQEGPAAAKP